MFLEYENRLKSVIMDMAKEFLIRGSDVILDFGFWNKIERDRYREIAKSVSVECILYSLECDMDIIKSRVSKRTQEMPDGELFIDENAIEILKKRFHALDADEHHIKIRS